MYYETRFSYDLEDAYTPDDESVEISYEDKQECINDFVNMLKKKLKNFDLTDTDFDDEYLYVAFFSDSVLDNVNINKILFGSSDGGYSATTSKEVVYGDIHDFDYYEEPSYDTTDVLVEMLVYDAKILHADDFEIQEALEESRDETARFKGRAEKRGSTYKKDAGNVEQGIQFFNSAMGEDLDNNTLNEGGYWASKPVRYKVYYDIHNNQVLEGGSNNLQEAEKFAKDCIERLATNPWEDPQDKNEAIESVIIYDHLQEEDVTTDAVEKLKTIYTLRVASGLPKQGINKSFSEVDLHRG